MANRHRDPPRCRADTPNPASTDLPGLTVPNFNGNVPGVRRTPKTATTRRGLATASLVSRACGGR